eukprot:snap_masked-scaffold103_size370364-processed-gene-1.16 protein:Tk07519 transcript:snap_masked-scaffold103_size370364-processed-gene-1.16-mRNA-1 annotation:"h2b3_tigca ame: full"
MEKAAKGSSSKAEKRKSRKRKESYAIYIYKVLKQVHPGTGISSKAMSIMNSFVNDIFERLAAEAARLAHYNKRSTITSREIQTAVRLLLPGELAKHAVSEGTKAVTKYTSAKSFMAVAFKITLPIGQIPRCPTAQVGQEVGKGLGLLSGLGCVLGRSLIRTFVDDKIAFVRILVGLRFESDGSTSSASESEDADMTRIYRACLDDLGPTSSSLADSSEIAGRSRRIRSGRKALVGGGGVPSEVKALKSQVGLGNIECASICQVSITFCNVFYTEVTDCFLGTMSMTPSPIMGPQSSSKRVFVDANNVGDLTTQFNSLTGVRSKTEWIRSMKSFVDLPPGNTLNDCLFQCLIVFSPCEIAIFETGRCHFGVNTLQGASNVSDIVVPDSTWDIYFSSIFRDWYGPMYPKELVTNATGSHWSKHVYAKVITSFLDLCHITCNFDAQYHLYPCQFYTFDNATSTCYLGHFANSPAIYGEIDTFADAYVLPDNVGDLTTQFNSLTGVRSKTEWIRSMKSFVDLPPGNTLNDCLFQCLIVFSPCEIAIFETGRCHFGVNTLQGASNVSDIVVPDSTWDIYFSSIFRDWYGPMYPKELVTNATGSHWSKHVYAKVITSFLDLCHITCNFDAQYHLYPCQFYTFDNATSTCYLGHFANSPAIYGEIDTFADAYVLPDYARSTAVTEELFVSVDLPLRIYGNRMVQIWDNMRSQEECAIYCLAGHGYDPSNTIRWPCQIFIYDNVTQQCHVGNLEFKDLTFTNASDAKVTAQVKRKIIEELVSGNDFTSPSPDSTWNKHFYYEVASEGIGQFHCAAYCILDTGPCNIMGWGPSGACYLGDWYIDTNLFSPPILAMVIHRTPELGVVLGGQDKVGEYLKTSDVFDEFRTTCKYPAVLDISQGLSNPAVTNGNEILDSTEVFNTGSQTIRTPGTGGKLFNPRHGHACGLIRNAKPGQDLIWAIGGTGPSGFHDTIEYFDVQDNTVWRVLISTVPSYETESLLPEAWSNIGSSHNGLIQFGAERYFLVSGERQLAGVMDSNIAFWQRDVGQFHGQTSPTMSTARVVDWSHNQSFQRPNLGQPAWGPRNNHKS